MFCGGAAIITVVLIGHRRSRRRSTVHEVQIVATGYAFELALFDSPP
jgi:hypothetical protein